MRRARPSSGHVHEINTRQQVRGVRRGLEVVGTIPWAGGFRIAALRNYLQQTW